MTIEQHQRVTVGVLQKIIDEAPANASFHVLNNQGVYTSLSTFWFEDLDTRQFVALDGQMKENEHTFYLTVEKMKGLLADIPEDVAINVMNEDMKYTANIEVVTDNVKETGIIVLKGLTPFYEMSANRLL